MKTASVIALMSSLMLSGCSFASLLPAPPTAIPPSATATPTIYMTPTLTPTITPTQPTPTFTPTPTLIYPNGRPAPSLTPTPPATLCALPSATASTVAQPLLGSGPFSTILVSGQQLFWGSCEPSSVTATVKVADPVHATGVLMFLRLKDTKSGETTKWGGGADMESKGGGVYTYILTAKAFEHYREFAQAFGQYQFVAIDAHLNRLGGSAQFLDNLTIQPCP